MLYFANLWGLEVRKRGLLFSDSTALLLFWIGFVGHSSIFALIEVSILKARNPGFRIQLQLGMYMNWNEIEKQLKSDFSGPDQKPRIHDVRKHCVSMIRGL